MRLRDIQNQFMTAMYNTTTSADEFIKPSSTLSANDRLAIYRGSVRGGLLQALADIYPVLEKLLGEQPFEGLCRRYINGHPSRSSNLAEYGSHFAEFIGSFKPLADYPYMSDVASLEWSWHQVFNEADSTPLDLEKLSQMSPDQHLELKFSRPQASRLIRSSWPVHLIWESNQPNESTTANNETLALIEQDYYFLVWRNGYEMRIDRLDANQWSFLSLLEQRSCFSDAVEHFITSNPDENVSALFASAISQGWIVDFE